MFYVHSSKMETRENGSGSSFETLCILNIPRKIGTNIILQYTYI
jgi:hypothetical protein